MHQCTIESRVALVCVLVFVCVHELYIHSILNERKESMYVYMCMQACITLMDIINMLFFQQ